VLFFSPPGSQTERLASGKGRWEKEEEEPEVGGREEIAALPLRQRRRAAVTDEGVGHTPSSGTSPRAAF